MEDIEYLKYKLMDELKYFKETVIVGLSIEDMDKQYEKIKRLTKQLKLIEDTLIIDRLRRGDED